MSQIHRWSLCVSDVASAFLNMPIDGSKGFIHVQAPPEIQYPEPTVWRLKRQLYDLRDSPRSWQVHLNHVLKSLNLSQMKSDPCTFTGLDSSCHLNLMVNNIGYGLRRRLSHSWRRSSRPEVHSGYSGDLQPQECGIPHFRSPKRVLGSDHQGQEVRSNHQDIHRQTLMDVTTQRRHQVSCQRVVNLSRSLINPQAPDFDNLIHLLKYVNQTRDFVYVMDPQIPTATSQGFIPVEVMRYSDADWAGCQITKINKWFTHHIVLCQSVFDKSYTGLCFTFKCRSWIVCYDSSSSRVIGDQALHQGTKISDSFQGCENHTQDRFICRQNNGLTSGHFKEVKTYRAQAFVDSRYSQWRKASYH